MLQHSIASDGHTRRSPPPQTHPTKNKKKQPLMERSLEPGKMWRRTFKAATHEIQLQQRVKNCDRNSPAGQKTLPHCRSNLSQWKAASIRLRLKAGLLRGLSSPTSPASALSLCAAFREHNSGLRLRFAVLTAQWRACDRRAQNPLLSLTGIGQRYTFDFFRLWVARSDTDEFSPIIRG